MKPKRKRSKGVLSGLGMLPKSTSKKKRRQPLWRRILTWIGGALMVVVLLVILFGTGAKFFRTNIGTRLMALNVDVEKILQDPALLPADGSAVAMARVQLVRDSVLIPLDEESFEEVQVGTTLTVEFEYKGLTREAEVLDWIVKPAEEDDGGEQEQEEDTPGEAEEPATSP